MSWLGRLRHRPTVGGEAVAEVVKIRRKAESQYDLAVRVIAPQVDAVTRRMIENVRFDVVLPLRPSVPAGSRRG